MVAGLFVGHSPSSGSPSGPVLTRRVCFSKGVDVPVPVFQSMMETLEKHPEI